MSLVPRLFSSWWQDLDRPHSIFDQEFGTGLYPEQLLVPGLLEALLDDRERRLRGYYRPWANLLRADLDSGYSTVSQDKDKFQVQLDVQQFAPEEIKTTVVDNCVQIEGKHEERRDEHGYISRQFTRRYMIPEQCDVDHVTSQLSSDGVLTITARRKPQPGDKNEKVIPIEKTGQPALKVKPTEKVEKAEQKTKAIKK